MAEQVQASLDRMVAPLRDLLDRQIFTEEETRAIVNRRRESEYLLRRRAARKADFVRYIEAEMLLEKLRALRTAKRKRDHRKAQREKGIDVEDDEDDYDEEGNLVRKKKKSNENENENDDEPIGDVHIVQHIHLLFVRAIRKFRSDVSLHLQHADFCKSAKSWTRLGRVYAEALQIFPREAGIWIEAASNEFFGPNRSVTSARVLLQRALRLNGNTSEELWLQYFTLELHYAQTLKGRKKILHPESERNEDDDDDDDNDNDDDGDDDKEDDKEDDNDKEGETEAKTSRTDDASSYNNIAMIILKNAVKAISNSVQFRLKFLDACQQFPDTADLMDFVQESMADDFSTEPESWIARAVYKAEQKGGTNEPRAKRARTTDDAGDEDSDRSDPVIAVLEDAVDTLRTTEMLLQAFRFAEDYRSELEQYGDESTTDSGTIEQIDAFINSVWSRAREGNIAGDSSELAVEQTRYLLRKGEEEEALNTIKKHCTTTLRPGAPAASTGVAPSEAWLLWASLAAPSLKKQTSILKRALESIPVDKHPDYVVVLLQHFAAQLKSASLQKQSAGNNDDKREKHLFETLQNLILLAPKTTGDISLERGSTGLEFELRGVFEGYKACLDHFYERRGISGARSIYEAVLFLSNAASAVSENNAGPIRDFVDRCLELEEDSEEASASAATAKSKKMKKKRVLCKLYDKAIDIFDGTPLEEPYRNDRNERAVFA